MLTRSKMLYSVKLDTVLYNLLIPCITSMVLRFSATNNATFDIKVLL